MAELAADNFNRADGALGANWTGLSNPFSIVSNQAKPGNPVSYAGDAEDAYTAITWPNDQYSQATMIGTGTGAGTGPGLLLREVNNTQFYRIIVDLQAVAGAGSVEVAKFNPTYTLLGTTMIGLTTPSGCVLTAQIVGSTITVYVNGVSVGTRTDAAIAAGNAGIAYSSVGGLDTAIDDWSGGDTPVFSAPAPVMWLGTL